MPSGNWSLLKKLVESRDFKEPPGFDASVLALVKKVAEGKAREISSAVDQKIITLKYLQGLCAKLSIDAKGATKATYLKDALIKAYQAEKDAIFLSKIRQAQEEITRNEEQFQEFYRDLCKSPAEVSLHKLKERFSGEGLEDRLKEFRRKCGIRAGGGTKTKLETRLKRIADELIARRAINGLR